jgi:hypothetical protein
MIAVSTIVAGGYFFGPLGAISGPLIYWLFLYLALRISDICPLAWEPAVSKFFDIFYGAPSLICMVIIIRIAWVSYTHPPAPRSNQVSVTASDTEQTTAKPSSTAAPVLNGKGMHGRTAAPYQGLDFGPGAPGG